MLRQMSESSSALHIERLKEEKQAQGKECRQNYILLSPPGKWKWIPIFSKDDFREGGMANENRDVCRQKFDQGGSKIWEEILK